MSSKKKLGFPNPKNGQHSRLTLEEAIAQYDHGLLTAAGLLYHAVKIYRACGQPLRVNDVSEFYEKLTLPKRTFYRAKAELVKKGYLDEEIFGTLELTAVEKNLSAKNGTRSAKNGNAIATNDSNGAKNGTVSAINGSNSDKSGNSGDRNGNSTSQNPSNCNGFSAPSTISQINTAIYISLSDLEQDERENFEKFVREEYRKSRGREIETTFAAFMKPEHFQEWYQKYQNRPEAITLKQNAKWENHPQRNEWLAEIESTSNPAMFAGSNKERQGFVSWCWKTKQFSWLKEEGNSDGI